MQGTNAEQYLEGVPVHFKSPRRRWQLSTRSSSYQSPTKPDILSRLSLGQTALVIAFALCFFFIGTLWYNNLRETQEPQLQGQIRDLRLTPPSANLELTAYSKVSLRDNSREMLGVKRANANIAVGKAFELAEIPSQSASTTPLAASKVSGRYSVWGIPQEYFLGYSVSVIAKLRIAIASTANVFVDAVNVTNVTWVVAYGYPSGIISANYSITTNSHSAATQIASAMQASATGDFEDTFLESLVRYLQPQTGRFQPFSDSVGVESATAIVT